MAEYAKRVGMVNINRAAFQSPKLTHRGKPSLRVGQTLRIQLFDDVVFDVQGERVDEMLPGYLTWVGKIPGKDYSHVAITFGEVDIAGSIDIGTRRFTLRSDLAKHNIVREVDFSLLPEIACDSGQHKELHKSLAGSVDHAMIEQVLSTAKTTSSTTIDVLVLYTARVAAQYGGNPSTAVAQQFSDMNTAFTNTGTLANVQIKALVPFNDFVEPAFPTLSTADVIGYLSDMDAGVNQFVRIPLLRNLANADLVTLLIDPVNLKAACGWSDVVDTPGGGNPQEAFSIITQECAGTDYTLPHELAHGLSGRHDAIPTANGGDLTNNAPYTYNHGYTDFAAPFRTIMGSGKSTTVVCGLAGCPRILRWSDPAQSVVIGGQSYVTGGSFQGGTITSNMNLALNNYVSIASSYRVGNVVSAARPTSLTVQRDSCYGNNSLYWPPVTIGLEWYEVQSAVGSSYAGASLIYSGTENFLDIVVTGTRYIRVRACNSVAGCGLWRNGNQTATYTNGCF